MLDYMDGLDRMKVKNDIFRILDPTLVYLWQIVSKNMKKG